MIILLVNIFSSMLTNLKGNNLESWIVRNEM